MRRGCPTPSREVRRTRGPFLSCGRAAKARWSPGLPVGTSRVRLLNGDGTPLDGMRLHATAGTGPSDQESGRVQRPSGRASRRG